MTIYTAIDEHSGQGIHSSAFSGSDHCLGYGDFVVNGACHVHNYIILSSIGDHEINDKPYARPSVKSDSSDTGSDKSAFSNTSFAPDGRFHIGACNVGVAQCVAEDAGDESDRGDSDGYSELSVGITASSACGREECKSQF